MKKRDKKKRRSMMDRRRREHKGTGGGFAYSPPDLPQFKPKKPEELRIDVIPFVAGKNNPFAPKAGELYFERTYYQHPNIGPSRAKVFCNLEMFRKPCYVCEVRAKMGRKPAPPEGRSAAEKKAFNDLLPKQRQVFLVRDRSEMKKGLQFFDESWHLLGKFLDNKLNTAKGKIKKVREAFAEPDGGSTLVLSPIEKPVGETGGKCLEFSDIQFEPREKPIKQELLDQASEVNLDSLFTTPADYEEVKALFQQAAPDDDEDEDEEEDDDEGGEDDEELDDEEDEDEDEEEESDDEDEDEESDEEDEDEDEAPCEKGDSVLFKHKGNKGKGKVIKLNLADSIVAVKDKKAGKVRYLEYDEILKVL